MRYRIEVWRDDELVSASHLFDGERPGDILDRELNRTRKGVYGIGQFRLQVAEMTDDGAVNAVTMRVAPFSIPTKRSTEAA